MTLPTLREYPQLPLIPLNLALKLFKRTAIGPSAASSATGITRVTFHRWMSGDVKRPSSASHDAVSTLAYKVLRALRHGHLPHPTKIGTKALLPLLDDDKYPVPLSDTAPQELLPKSWLDQFNLPREHHATESVL